MILLVVRQDPAFNVFYLSYMLFLLSTHPFQVEQLESQLLAVQSQKEEAVQKDLLVYIKSMPEHQLQVTTLPSTAVHVVPVCRYAVLERVLRSVCLR